MKKLIITAFVALLVAGCNNAGERQATVHLDAAREAFEAHNYDLAKAEIDSIRVNYPKAVEARKQAVVLMQQVELEEAQHKLVGLDSLLAEKEAIFDSIKHRFLLEKDTAYQETGNYFWPTQTVEKNLHRSFLRFQVSEAGMLTMTSIYAGPHHIHHIAVKVVAPDKTFAETPASEDSYETTNLNEKIEKADYPMGKDGNVMAFINLNRDKNLRVEYMGERPYSTTMSQADRQALAELYELSKLLTTIHEIRKERDDAQMKIGFITRKMEIDRERAATK